MKKDHTQFFNDLAIECGITDIKAVRSFYYSLVRTLYKNLRRANLAEMPDWGKYKIKPHAARRIHDLKNGGTKDLPTMNTIRFEADYKLKERIRDMDAC